MSTLRHVTGDVTLPRGSGPTIIAHVCNDVGVITGADARSIMGRWPEAEHQYRAWWEGRLDIGGEMRLGKVQVVRVDEDLWVANMIALRGLPSPYRASPIRYAALSHCLAKLARLATNRGAAVHMPAPEDADPALLEDLIDARLLDAGIDVTVYRL